MVPTNTPPMSHRTAAPIARLRLTGTASLISSTTEVFSRNEYPRQGALQWIVWLPSPRVCPNRMPLM